MRHTSTNYTKFTHTLGGIKADADITVIDFCATVSLFAWMLGKIIFFCPWSLDGKTMRWKEKKEGTKWSKTEIHVIIGRAACCRFSSFFSLSHCVTFIGNNLKYDTINNKRWQHTFFSLSHLRRLAVHLGRQLHKSCLNKLENATIQHNDKDTSMWW